MPFGGHPPHQALVGHRLIGGYLRQQRVGADQVVRLSRGQQKRRRVAERVGEGAELCAQPAAAAADRLIMIFSWRAGAVADLGVPQP
jgi:hypothetical protein